MGEPLLPHKSIISLASRSPQRRSIYTALRLRIEFRHRVPALLMRYRPISTAYIRACGSPSDGDCRVMITAHHKPAFAAFVNTNGRKKPLCARVAPSFAIRGGALVHRPAGTDSLHGGNKMIYKPASISPDFRPRRMALMLCGFLLVSTIFSPPGGADQPTNKALVTDKTNLPLSDQFAPPGQIRLTNSGDVFFNPGGLAFFRWSSGSGSRTRLLQGGDPHPGIPGSVCDVIGSGLQTNSSGHAAMLNTFAVEDARNPRGVFVFDGASVLKVALRHELAPGTGGHRLTKFARHRS